MTIAPTAIFMLALSAGFTPPEAHTLVCVAEYESSYRPQIVNVNKNGSRDLGLMQINEPLWADTLCQGLDLLEAEQNLECAYRIFVEYDRKFTPWIAYRLRQSMCDNHEVSL